MEVDFGTSFVAAYGAWVKVYSRLGNLFIRSRGSRNDLPRHLSCPRDVMLSRLSTRQDPKTYELWSRLLKGGDIRDYIGESYAGY